MASAFIWWFGWWCFYLSPSSHLPPASLAPWLPLTSFRGGGVWWLRCDWAELDEPNWSDFHLVWFNESTNDRVSSEDDPRIDVFITPAILLLNWRRCNWIAFNWFNCLRYDNGFLTFCWVLLVCLSVCFSSVSSFKQSSSRRFLIEWRHSMRWWWYASRHWWFV